LTWVSPFSETPYVTGIVVAELFFALFLAMLPTRFVILVASAPVFILIESECDLETCNAAVCKVLG